MSSSKKKQSIPEEAGGLFAISETTKNTERHWIGGRKTDLPVYRIPISQLYFNIENGRYADRMLLLRAENKGVDIDPREERWKTEIENMLAGEHRDTARDKDAFKKLKEDLDAREQLRPGVALQDGGVLDGNRRLAALRRLWRETHSDRYAYFEAVILPRETTDEERWKIEAGLQLGLNERHDYSPINELIKVRQGLQMYQRKLDNQELPAGRTAYELVASAIYGKTESDVREMARRLDLVDAYLAFIGKPNRYDLVGESSERFLEALRVLGAAENQERDPELIAKLRAVLFYIIHNDLMDNWQLREIYHSLGGDPTKRGRKRQPNDVALEKFLSEFPSPREIQKQLGGGTAVIPESKASTKPVTQGKLKLVPPSAGPPATKPAKQAPAVVDKEKAGEAVEKFLRTQESSNNRQSLKRTATGALASLESLNRSLKDPKTVKALTEDEVFSLRETLQAVSQSVKDCLKALK